MILMLAGLPHLGHAMRSNVSHAFGEPTLAPDFNWARDVALEGPVPAGPPSAPARSPAPGPRMPWMQELAMTDVGRAPTPLNPLATTALPSPAAKSGGSALEPVPLFPGPAALDPVPPVSPMPATRSTALCLAPESGFGRESSSFEPPSSPGGDAAVFGRRLARAARGQTADFVVYNPRYVSIAYPSGDVAALYGVCTDVVIRAFRALGIDLQALIKQARVGSGDTSIDHRRVEVLRRFLGRYGQSLPASEHAEDYQPGDIVTYRRTGGRGSQTHVAIVSDRMAPSGRPLIVHNRGWGPQLEDALFVDPVTGHYRVAMPAAQVMADATRAAARPVTAKKAQTAAAAPQ